MWYIDRAMGNPVADTFYVNQARQTLRQLETFDFSLICEARLQTSRPPLTSIENVQTGWYLYWFKDFDHIKMGWAAFCVSTAYHTVQLTQEFQL